MPTYLRTNNTIKNLDDNSKEVYGSINKAKRHSRTLSPDVLNSTLRTPTLHCRVGDGK